VHTGLDAQYRPRIWLLLARSDCSRAGREEERETEQP